MCSFLIVSYILSSCGTISGNSQIMSLDTSMKEVSIYEVENRYADKNIDTEYLYQSRNTKNSFLKDIGKTPVFYKTNRSYGKTYILEKDGILSQEYLECSIRWKESILPNLSVSATLYFINPIVSLLTLSSSLSIDAISGSIFDCRDRVFFNFPDKYTEKYIDKKEYERVGARFILIPLASKDKTLSQTYTEQWKKQNQDKLISYFKKISFVPSSFVLNRLEVYGIDIESGSDNTINLDSFLPSQILELGYLTNATHIIFINKKKNKIVSTTIDIHSLENISADLNLEPLILYKDSLEKINEKKWYFSFMKFFPNSFTFSFPVSSYIDSSEKISISKNNIVTEYNLDYKEDKTSFLKRSFSGLGIDRVEHFKKYNIIDISFLLYFNLNFISEDVLLSYKKDKDQPNGTTDNIDIDIFYFNMLVANNIGFSLHTAIGSINTLLVLGPSIERYSIDSFSNTGLNLIYGLKNEWSYFVNDNLFIYLSGYLYKYLKSSRKVELNYELVNETKDFKTFSLSSSYYIKAGIGYYFGNSFRDKTISLLDNL